MSEISQHIQGKQETLESAASYAVGGGGALIASLVEVSHLAQALAIILGCAIVAVRLIHDTVRLFRYLSDK